jgi:phage baseplate assembly protein W
MAGLSPKLPVQRDSADGYALTKTYTQMVLQNLKNLLLTVPGERMMDPLFGVGLNRFLFESHAPATYSNIHAKTVTQVGKYMPFVMIDDMLFYGPDGIWSASEGFVDIGVEPDVSLNHLQIKVFLSIVPLGKQTTLDLEVQV